MFTRILVCIHVLLLIFCLGCAGARGFLSADLLLPDPGAPTVDPETPYAPDAYNPNYANTDPGDPGAAGIGGWDNIRPHSMMMFYLGQREDDRDDWFEISSSLYSAIGASPKEKWNEIGLQGVSIMRVVGEPPLKHGFGIDWRFHFANVDSKKDSVFVDIANASGLTGMDYIDESIFIMEGQVAFRYVLFPSKYAWPFVRAGLGIQMASYDWKGYDPILKEVAIERDAVGVGLGTVWGLGCLFAVGDFRAEIGFGISMMKIAMNVDTDKTIADLTVPTNPTYTTYDISAIADRKETFRFGGDPSFYITIGGGI